MTGRPNLKRLGRQRPRTPYLVGVFGSESILCLAITTSDISLEISSSSGPICLHGPKIFSEDSPPSIY
jgi:hypothetical protein